MNRANRRVLDNFEKAVRAHEDFKRATNIPQSEIDAKESLYEVNKGALEALIEYLEKPRRSAREKELQRVVDQTYLTLGQAIIVDPNSDAALDQAESMIQEASELLRPFVVPPTQ